MFKFIQRFLWRIKPINWIPINEVLVGKGNLFTMRFTKNWFYNVNGNSFYSIHNEIDDLKGGIQISIIWNMPVVKSIKDIDHLDSILQVKENAETQRVIISGLEAIYFQVKYPDNNMDFYYWYLRFDNVYFKISYFIFEEEPLEKRNNWYKHVNDIIHTIEINKAAFKTVRMK